jgi:hypothetical protein
MEGSIRLRAVRAALFAALCVTLSSTSHVLLSRTPLPATLVATVFAAVFAVAFATGRRERGYWAVAGLLVPMELAADTLFTTGQRTCYGPGGGPVTGPLRSFGADVICGGGTVGEAQLPGAAALRDGTTAAAAQPWLPWLLLAVHVSVGLLASWWLRRGEAALARSLRAAGVVALGPLVRAAAVLRALPAAAGTRPPAVRPGAPRPRPWLAVAHCVVRRGPPAALAA